MNSNRANICATRHGYYRRVTQVTKGWVIGSGLRIMTSRHFNRYISIWSMSPCPSVCLHLPGFADVCPFMLLACKSLIRIHRMLLRALVSQLQCPVSSVQCPVFRTQFMCLRPAAYTVFMALHMSAQTPAVIILTGNYCLSLAAATLACVWRSVGRAHQHDKRADRK